MAARVSAFDGLLAQLGKRGLDVGRLADIRRHGDEVGAAIRRARAAGMATDLASARLARVCEAHAGGLAKLVAKALPAPGDHRPEAGGTVLPGVELLVEFARLAPASDPVRAANDRVVQAIVAAAKVFHDDFMRRIEGVDAIDMRQAAADLMRLDILLWLLEILKADEAGRCVRQQSLIVARGALRRARRVADAY
ncbi:MAG: hypothetical protein HQL38_13990, partial [Alphaproteobacteria bacterium]|nr:hypothetical protein [Alphaproteobacteria bacterium]